MCLFVFIFSVCVCSVTNNLYYLSCFNRNFWNQISILLSLAINGLMLVTWNARASLGDIDVAENATALPPSLLE